MNTSLKKIKGLIAFKGKKINTVLPSKDGTLSGCIETLFTLRNALMTSLGVKIDASHYYTYESNFNGIEVKIKIASRKKNNAYLKGTVHTVDPVGEILKIMESSYLSFYQADLSWTNTAKKKNSYTLMQSQSGDEFDIFNQKDGVIDIKLNLIEKQKVLEYVDMPKLIEHLEREISIKKTSIKHQGKEVVSNSLIDATPNVLPITSEIVSRKIKV